MKIRFIFFSALFMATCLVGSPLKAVEFNKETLIRSHGDGPKFYLDYINFNGTDDKTLVKFYLDISYNQLQFIKFNQQFQAGYDLEFYVLDDKNEIVESYKNHDVFEVNSYKESKTLKKARIAPVAFLLNPDEYRFKVIVTDLETLKSSQVEDSFIVRSFLSPELQISDVQLCQKILPGEPGLPSVRSNYYLEPNVYRVFGSNFNTLNIFFEVYNFEVDEKNIDSSYTAYFIFHNERGEKIGQYKCQKTKPASSCANILKIPLDEFSRGNYSLTVRVQDNSSNQIVETRKSFTIIDSHFSLLEYVFENN